MSDLILYKEIKKEIRKSEERIKKYVDGHVAALTVLIQQQNVTVIEKPKQSVPVGTGGTLSGTLTSVLDAQKTGEPVNGTHTKRDIRKIFVKDKMNKFTLFSTIFHEYRKSTGKAAVGRLKAKNIYVAVNWLQQLMWKARKHGYISGYGDTMELTDKFHAEKK